MLENDVVMVVDDSSSIRQIITATLRTHLYCRNILQAASGKEALELIEKNERIDWILSDWEMPRMGGDELLLKIRQHPKTKTVPFIMITSRKDRDSLITAAQAGVTDYLIKPFTAAALTEKIRKVAISLERRAHSRFIAETTNKVRITFKNGFTVEGGVDNLSETGALFKTPLFRT
ncbi:MAG: response regulator, partial [Nitrospinae bacterium]|nr:response regulator [Nitrospinota bacterium]